LPDAQFHPFDPSLRISPLEPVILALLPIKEGAAEEYAQICHSAELCDPEGSPAWAIKEMKKLMKVSRYKFLNMFKPDN
jgi:hypothetical protein